MLQKTYATLREKIAAEKIERQARYAKFEAAYNKAAEAGREAGKAAVPAPMIVVEHENPLNDASPAKKAWHVPGGACGFAWVTVTPGTCSFAKWLVKNKLAGKAYYGGVQISVSAFGQSVERKEACAHAMAEILKAELGVKAYAGSRLD